MSETLERRRERLAGLEARDWCWVDCTAPGCGAGNVVTAPARAASALCASCLAARASESAAISLQRLQDASGVHEAGSAVPYAPRAAERAAQGCPVCATTQREPLCTYPGHVEAVAPELVCPPDACGHAVPGPMLDLMMLFTEHGWITSHWHSRGKPAGARAVAEMWSVRFRRGTWAGYAVRRGGAWGSVCITGTALPPFLALGVTELREWLADPEACGPAWCDAIRAKVARAALHAKEVRCPGSPVCKPQGPLVPGGAVVIEWCEHTHRADGAIVKKVSRKERVGAA